MSDGAEAVPATFTKKDNIQVRKAQRERAHMESLGLQVKAS